MEYPHLIENSESYWVAYDEGYCRGIADKVCSLKDADWLRKAYHHEINWECGFDKALREAHERTVSTLLLEDMVVALEQSDWSTEEKPN